MAERDSVISWYEKKTDSIIEKYGPGPEIYFHTGIIDPDASLLQEPGYIKNELIRSQRALINKASRIWRFGERLTGKNVVDIGCGLGGTSIFMARNYGSTVYALTNVPSHVAIIEEYVRELGLEEKIKPALGDAHDMPLDLSLDAAVAIESSCYLDRGKWFRHLSEKITPGGYVFISDCLGLDEKVFQPFNEYWLTNLGTPEEYRAASEKAGFELLDFQDISNETSRFWDFNVHYSKIKQEQESTDEKERIRLKTSIEWQSKLSSFWKNREIMYALLTYRRK
jgi:tocopherol O-methyltransferase